MLVARHIRRFCRVVTLLQRCKDFGESQRIHEAGKPKHTKAPHGSPTPSSSSSTSDEFIALSSSSSFSSERRLPPPSTVLVDRIVFRDIPISLSLLERAMVKQQAKQQQRQERRGKELHPHHLTSSSLSTSAVNLSSFPSHQTVAEHGGRKEEHHHPHDNNRSSSMAPLTTRDYPSIPSPSTFPTSSSSPSSSSSSLSLLLPPPLLVDLLKALHDAESERRWCWTDKMSGIHQLEHRHATNLRRISHRIRLVTQKYQKCVQTLQNAKGRAFHHLSQRGGEREKGDETGGRGGVGGRQPHPFSRHHDFEQNHPSRNGGPNGNEVSPSSSSQHHQPPPQQKEKEEGEKERVALEMALRMLHHRRQQLLVKQKENKEDARLLEQQSLLSRPFLSAKLWKLLLLPDVWMSALRDRQGTHPHGYHHHFSSSSSSFKGSCLSDGELVRVLWCWSRVVMGILRDVVEKRQPLPSASPRFAVSLPSRSYRRRQRGQRLEQSLFSSLPGGRGNPPRHPHPSLASTESTTATTPEYLDVSKTSLPPPSPGSPLVFSSFYPKEGNEEWKRKGRRSGNHRMKEEDEERKEIHDTRMDGARSLAMKMDMSMMSSEVRVQDDQPLEQQESKEEEEVAMVAETHEGKPYQKEESIEKKIQHNEKRRNVILSQGARRLKTMKKKSIKKRKMKAKDGSGAVLAVPTTRVALRWLPPPSRDLLPLLVETLGLWRHLLGEIKIETLLKGEKDGKSYSSQSASSSPVIIMLISLLVAVQEAATMTLLLHSDSSPSTPHTTSFFSPSSSSSSSANVSALHTVLHELEEVLLLMVGSVRRGLAPPSSFSSLPQPDKGVATLAPSSPTPALLSSTPAILQGLPPPQAAQLLLHLHHLHALSPTSTAAQYIVQQGCLLLFPQLRTNTWEVLIGRARQTSILSFISRSQRTQLQRHGLPPESVLKNANYRARLEQRQRSAILRSIHLSDIQLQTVVCLAESFPPLELVSLLQLLVSHLVIREEEGGRGRREKNALEDEDEGDGENNFDLPKTKRMPRGMRRGSGRRGVVSNQPSSRFPLTTRATTTTINAAVGGFQRSGSHVLMAALLLGEAILLTEEFQRSATPSTTTFFSFSSSLNLHHLADLWVGISVMKPLVEASRATLPSSVSSLSSSLPSSGAPLFHTLAGQVIQAIQEKLASLMHGSSPLEEEEEEERFVLGEDDEEWGKGTKGWYHQASHERAALPLSPPARTTSSLSIPSDLALILHKITAGILRWEEESGEREMEWDVMGGSSGGAKGRGVRRLFSSPTSTSISSQCLRNPLQREVYYMAKMMKEVLLHHTPSLQRELRRRFPVSTKDSISSPPRKNTSDNKERGRTELFQKSLIHCLQRMSLLDSVVERAVKSIGSDN